MADEQNELERHRINELRQRFFHENGSNLQEFHEQDVKRVRDDDGWLSSFLKSRKQEVNDALTALVECVRWRKSFGVNDLTERSVDRRLFEAGFLFPYNQDKDGNTLVIFTGKLYRKDPQQQPEVKRLLVFLLERHAKMFPDRKITMIFDMQETGLAHMDLEFVKFVISCFRDYFPWTLAWLLVVELPWILSAAWKIVKSWLSPEGVNKIRFLSKVELTEVIDEDKLLIRLGGTDPYEYSYPPTKEALNSLGVASTDNVEDVPIANGFLNQSIDFEDDSEESQANQQLLHSYDDREEAPSTLTKKVTFEDVPTVASQGQDSSTSPANTKQRESPTKSPFRAVTPRLSQRRAPPDGFTSSASLLVITPSEELVFTGTTSTGEILQSLSLANTTLSAVAFKVKTTSPESYRVRPSSGMIPASSSAEVSVFLQPGHAASVIRDKFLVMSTELQEEKSPSELAALWKTIPKANIVEHRLRCRFLASNSSHYSEIADGKPVTLSMAIDNIQSLQRQLNEVEKKLDATNKRIAHIDEGLHVFIKVQLGLFSAMIVLFAVVMYYATYFM